MTNQFRFCDVYAAGGQRRRIDEGWASDEFLTHLRVDTLLARWLVLPDTYLLDGAYFLRVNPRELARRLGRGLSDRKLPILVRTRKNH